MAHIPLIPYEGSLLDKNDLEFTLSLFPTSERAEAVILRQKRWNGVIQIPFKM